MERICPERDARCPHGDSCQFALSRYSCKPGWKEARATSHTPQPLAGDDLVARLRDNPLWPTGASRSLTDEAADRIESLQRQLRIVDDLLEWEGTGLCRVEAIEALTSQQHTVAGEVERYSLNIPTAQMQVDKNGLFVLASSYDSLAAAKDRLEKINADHCRTVNTYVVDNARLANRTEAVKRQRDALRETLRQVKQRIRFARGAVETGQVEEKDVHGSLSRIMDQIDAALKDEGGST